jgi:hypothetical protein
VRGGSLAPAATASVPIAVMRHWAQVALDERRRRIERQLGKDWRRITPAKAKRAIEVGEALIALLKEMEASNDMGAGGTRFRG